MDYDAFASYLMNEGTKGDISIWVATGYFFNGELPLEAFIEALKKRGFEESKLRRFLEDDKELL